MELNKNVIHGKNHSQTVYCPISEVVDDKNYKLLGFKDCLPVLSGKMNENKSAVGVKKTLKVEIDPETGEKFINLNGKKIKIIPESKLPVQLPKNAQVRKIASLSPLTSGSLPVKVKVLKGVSLKNSKFSLTGYTNNDNTSNDEGNQIIPEISKINCLSPKTLIKESAFVNVKTLSCNNTIKVNTVDNNPQQHSDMLESERKSVVIECKTDSKNTSNGSGQIVKDSDLALDLRKYSVKQNQTENISQKVDGFAQTDKIIIVKDKNVVDASVQTDEETLSDLELYDIMQALTPDLQPTPIPSEPFNNSFIPSKNLLDLNNHSQSSKTLNNLNHQVEANKFFTELRMALQPDEKGNMRIHLAVLDNNLSMVKRSWFILKTLNQSVDLPNNNDYTALQLAVINDASKDIISFLLSKQASLGVTDSEGNNVMHLAIEYRRTDALQILLDYAFKTNFNLDQYNHEGLTPLMICCLNGLHECAKLLLDFDADINVRDQISGRTALFHAAECHDVEMVHCLLKYQADTKIKNFFGTSPHDAMYEIEDVPDQIKSMILGKNNKRKAIDDARPLKMKREDHEKSKSTLKTYARFQKISQTEIGKNLLTSVK